MSEKRIVRVWVDPECMSDSRPCQHFTELEYEGGEKEDRIDNSSTILQYSKDGITITGCDISHFEPPKPRNTYKARIESECHDSSTPCKHKVTTTEDDGSTTEELLTVEEIDELIEEYGIRSVYVTRTALRHFAEVRRSSA